MFACCVVCEADSLCSSRSTLQKLCRSGSKATKLMFLSGGEFARAKSHTECTETAKKKSCYLLTAVQKCTRSDLLVEGFLVSKKDITPELCVKPAESMPMPRRIKAVIAYQILLNSNQHKQTIVLEGLICIVILFKTLHFM